MPTFNIKNIKTYSILKRKNKVKESKFAIPYEKGDGVSKFYKKLPDILAAKDIRCIVDDIILARKKKAPVVFMLGAHVIKCGLSPIIIDLIKKDIITCIALNGAGLIHDFEIALIGSTSEDVGKALDDGSFGMADETSRYINTAIKKSTNLQNVGLGSAVGDFIFKNKSKFPHKEHSILYNCSLKKIPVTVHVGIGTDIIHQHPLCDGAAIGKGSLSDFYRLAKVLSKLENGVVINFGSSVILPEVFLKALNIARNLGFKVKNFTSADFDMIKHYRPHQNVVSRPTRLSSKKGYSITGHHEIMLPLLSAFLIDRIG